MFNADLIVVVVLPTLSEGWGRGGTPRRPNSRAKLQGLDEVKKGISA